MPNRPGQYTRRVVRTVHEAKLALTSEIASLLEDWPVRRTRGALRAARALGFVDAERTSEKGGELVWWLTPDGERALTQGFHRQATRIRRRRQNQQPESRGENEQ